MTSDLFDVLGRVAGEQQRRDFWVRISHGIEASIGICRCLASLHRAFADLPILRLGQMQLAMKNIFTNQIEGVIKLATRRPKRAVAVAWEVGMVGTPQRDLG